MSSPTDPPPEESPRPSVPGPREEADGWATPGDPYAAPPPPTTGRSGTGGPSAHDPYDPYGAGGPLGPGSQGWAPKPGIVALRPLGVGEILDGAVSYIRAHPRLTLGLSAVVAVVAYLIGTPLTRLVGDGGTGGAAPTPTPSPAALADQLSAQASAALPLNIVVGLASLVLTGLLIVTVSRSVLGAPVDGGQVWRAVRPRIPGLVGVALLSGLAVGLVVAVGALPGALLLIAGAGVAGGIVIGLGLLVGLLAALALFVTLSLAPAVYVLEGGGVVAALKRSWALVTPRFWPVLGITLLARVISTVISIILVALFGGIAAGAAAVSGADAAGGVLATVIGAVGGIVVMALVTPFEAGVTGLLYVDSRMRREGFDIELQRAASFRSW